jgi:phospholipase B1
MAGYAMMNVLNLNTAIEFRGLSYLMGADQGAVSVANFIKHYNPDLHGLFSSSHIVSYLKRRSYLSLYVFVSGKRLDLY